MAAGAMFSSPRRCVGGGEPVARFRPRTQALFCTPRGGTAVEPALDVTHTLHSWPGEAL